MWGEYPRQPPIRVLPPPSQSFAMCDQSDNEAENDCNGDHCAQDDCLIPVALVAGSIAVGMTVYYMRYNRSGRSGVEYGTPVTSSLLKIGGC